MRMKYKVYMPYDADAGFAYVDCTATTEEKCRDNIKNLYCQIKIPKSIEYIECQMSPVVQLRKIENNS